MLACVGAVAAASPLANRYIDLIENAVTGSLHDEAGRCIMGGDHYTCSAVTGEDGKPVFAPYNSTLRLLGRDWPPFGHTMVGHMRLRRLNTTYSMHLVSRCVMEVCTPWSIRRVRGPESEY